MAVQLCTPQMLNFSFSQAGRSESRPRYILLTADVDKLVNSRDVLEQLRNQFGSRELAAEEIWQSYQTFYTGPGRAVRYKMTAGTSMKCNLGHIPMTVIAWREAGTGASGIDVVGRVDTSRMPPHHPQVLQNFKTSTSSSSPCSNLIRRMLIFQRASTSPTSPCQLQTSRPSNLPLNVWSRFAQTRPCILITLFFSTFLSLSIFLGVFFTVNKGYGYSLGDAFTLAGFVFGVGSVCTSVLVGCHFPHCECWRRGRVKMCTE